MSDQIIKNEIATVANDITSQLFGGVMRSTDDTLLTRGGGKGLKIYDEIERDCHAYAVLQKRKMALIAREWVVDPATSSRLDKRAADLVREQLANLSCDIPDDEVLPQVTGFDAACLNLLDANLKGFSVGEIMWASDGQEIVAAEIRARDQRRFEFSPGNRGYRLHLKTWSSLLPGEPTPPRKFITHSFGAKDGNPFGLGLGHKLFWPCLFKRQDITFWLTFVDKFAAPTGVGKYPAGSSPEDQAKLLAALSAIASEAGVIIPDGMLIEYLEAQRSGSIDTYERLARYMDEQISECVLGETLSTNLGGGGSLAAAQVHNDVRLELVKADADLLCGTLNGTLVKWITFYNVPGATPPKVWRDCSEPEDLKALATRDKLIVDMGFKPTLAYIHATYGGEWTESTPAKPTPPLPGIPVTPPVQFAEGDAATDGQTAIDSFAAAFTADELQVEMAAVLKPVMARFQESGDFAEAMESLAKSYPEMATDRLQDLLARMIFVSECWGRLSAA